MHPLPWKPFALLAVATVVGVFAVQGCGSDDTPPADIADASADQTSQDDGGPIIQTDGNPDDGNTGPCRAVGDTCSKPSDCCLGNCDTKTGKCVNPVGTCKAGGVSCTVSVECCTYVCQGGVCGSKLCTSDNQACTTDAECCGGKCSGVDGGAGTCTPLNPSCHTAGNTCTGHSQCCSKLCQNGICQGQPSYCTQIGDICATDFECCSGTCNKQQGASVGVCGSPTGPGAGNCTINGQVCGSGAFLEDGGTFTLTDAGLPPCGGECCSRSCGPYPTGVTVCQPPSGCRPTGEICRQDSDCCGFGGVQNVTGVGTCSKANPTDRYGRCDNGNACRPAGAICKLNKQVWGNDSCNAENNCCSGNVNQNPFVCMRDALGIPRCTISGTACTDGGSRAGQACASTADCCGLACVPNPSFDGGTGDAAAPPFYCGTACVPASGACTSNADCCPGLPCVIPPGGSSGLCGGQLTDGGGVIYPDGGLLGDGSVTSGDAGTCSFAGQQCTTSTDCCRGLTCNPNTLRCESFIR
jgi:hypothetical protein